MQRVSLLRLVLALCLAASAFAGADNSQNVAKANIAKVAMTDASGACYGQPVIKQN